VADLGDKPHPPRRRRWAHRLDGGVDDRRQIDLGHLDPQLAGDDARDVEQILDEIGLHLGVALDGLERALLLGLVELPRAEEARPAEDGVERRAQLVRDRRQELVLDARRPLGRQPRLARLDLRGLEVVDVGERRDEADDEPIRLAVRHRAREVPPPLAVVAPPDAQLELDGLSARHRLRPAHPRERAIVGVHDLQPTVAAERRDPEPGVAHPLGVGAIEAAVEPRRQQALRHGVDERAEAMLGAPLVLLALALPEQHRLPADALLLRVELHEHRHLRPEDLGIERLQDVVDGAALVSLEDERRILADRGQEDDRDGAGALALLDELRRLQPVDAGHLDVHQDDRELLLEERPQRLLARVRAHEALAERAQDRLQRDEVRRVIVDHQDRRDDLVRVVVDGPRRVRRLARGGRLRLEGAQSRTHSLRTSVSLSASTGFGR
jgi:hypothetical protein